MQGGKRGESPTNMFPCPVTALRGHACSHQSGYDDDSTCLQSGQERKIDLNDFTMCESRGGRPGLSGLMSPTVYVDVKQHCTMLRHWSQFVLSMSTNNQGHEASTSSSS